MTEHKYSNKLINEKSPYLLQHAHNPVDWYSWGPEAFSRAVGEDKPIFLSIGYSTCHWCHVMERESFEDQQVADILNKYFICIKVDREERPDIDSIYMSVCQSLTGHGGWPLTVFLTPEKHPFYAGTYFPKHDSMGMMGIISLLETVNNAWKNNRKTLLDSAKQILAFEKNDRRSDHDRNISQNVIHDLFSQLKYNFDSKYGGFGNAPKFPTPHNLLFLLRYWYSQQEPYALEIVEKTLESMRNGGIYDHVGFGFSRYSTDKKWLVPHFEKMLYDNALLCLAYAETYQATGNKDYSDTAQQVLEYVLRDMTSPEGGFYSAEDADSEGVEGKFYVWSVDEIKEILGEKDGQEYCKMFDITESGNFEGLNIPNLINSGNLTDEQKTFSDNCRKKLFTHRETRVHPYKDDKILTSWNGLMIAAMAYCGKVFGETRYIVSAQKCADFILQNLVRYDGRLLERYRDGEAALPAYLDDYAFLVWGLIELYEATYDPFYLKKALDFNNAMLDLFSDKESEGLFLYGHDSEELITRPKECYDGAIPSGNSAAVTNLLRLARITGHHDFESKASDIISYFSLDVEGVPTGHSYMLCGYLYLLTKLSSEVVMVGSDKSNMIKIFNSVYQPFTVSIANLTPELLDIVPHLSEYNRTSEKSAAFVCQNFSCMAPITDDIKFKEALSENLPNI